jgi:hypothetical protein
MGHRKSASHLVFGMRRCAPESGDTAAMKNILDNGAEVDSRDEDGRTALPKGILSTRSAIFKF